MLKLEIIEDSEIIIRVSDESGFVTRYLLDDLSKNKVLRKEFYNKFSSALKKGKVGNCTKKKFESIRTLLEI